MTPKDVRERVVQEDTLLGTRTTSFLLSNGFLMAALGISSVHFEKAIMAILGIFLSIIWLFVSWQSRQAITALHILFHEKFPNDEINKLVFKSILWEKKFIITVLGPTELLCFWLPSVVLLAWLSINYNLHFGGC